MTEKESPILKKSYAFAFIVKLHKHLSEVRQGYGLSKEALTK